MKYLIIILSLLANSIYTVGQEIIWEENFEDSNSQNFVVSNTFKDGCNDHFSQTDGTDVCISSCNQNDSYIGFNGLGFWAGEDQDDAGGGGDEIDEKVIIFPLLNTGNFSNLVFKGLFAAGNNCGDENSAYDDVDYIRLFYINSKKDTVLFLAFESEENNSNQTNEPLAQDTDFDGIGDGVELNETFQEFTSTLPNDEQLQIFIEFHLDSDKEEAAIDYFQVMGTVCIKPFIGEISVSQGSNCPGSNVTLSLVDSDLNDALQWEWYGNNCGNNLLGTGSSIEVAPEISSEYFVRGTGNCISNGECISVEVEIIDVTAPTISQYDTVFLYNDLNCKINVPDISQYLIITDDCSNNFDIQQNPSAGEHENMFSTIDIVSMDQSRNSLSKNLPIYVLDTIPPTITGPEVLNYSITEGCQFILGQVSDSLKILENCEIKQIKQSIPKDSALAVGQYTVEFLVEDISENVSLFETELFVSDNQNPVISGPAFIEKYSTNNCNYIMEDLTANFEYSDNCGLNKVTQLPEPGTEITNESPLLITATDNNGNLTSFESSIVLIDTIPPTIIGPDEVNIEIIECSGIVPDIIDLIKIEDNCNSELTISQIPPVGTEIENSVNILIKVSDSQNNKVSKTVKALLVDRIEPEIICPESIEVVSHKMLSDYTSRIVANDNCDSEVTIIQNPTEGESYLNISELSFTATDTSGNQAVCFSPISIITSVLDSHENIKIYPNPANQYLIIENTPKCLIKIVDLKGNTILRKEYKNDYIKINLQDFNPGNYAIIISTELKEEKRLLHIN